MVEDIINANIEKLGNKDFCLGQDASKKYADFFKKGNTSGDILGIFFLRDANTIVNLIKYYSGFKKIVVYDLYLVNETLKAYFNIIGFSTVEIEFIDIGKNVPVIEFDKIIMNPPYDKSLHLKILDATIKENPEAEIVNLSPIRWLQDPLAEYKKNSDWKKFSNIREHISSLDVVPANDANDVFEVGLYSDLGIYFIDRSTPHIKISWKQFKTKAEAIMISKLIEMKDSLGSHVEKNKADGIRVPLTMIGGNRGYKPVYKDIPFTLDGKIHGKWWTDAKNMGGYEKPAGSPLPLSVKFNTEDEALNFYSFWFSKIGAWICEITHQQQNIQENVLPYLGDYTHPWTDEDLYKYFNLTKDETTVIENEV